MVVTGTCWVEARAAVKHPTRLRSVIHSQQLSCPKCQWYPQVGKLVLEGAVDYSPRSFLPTNYVELYLPR